MRFKKLVGAIAALALGVGLAVGTGVMAASAHTVQVVPQVSCQADGTYTITWKVHTSNVPEHTEGEVKVISPVNVWLYEWTEHHANHGLPPLAPNEDFQWVQTGVPGTAKTASVTFQIDWKDGYSLDPIGEAHMEGDCSDTPESSKITFCHATSSESNPYTKNETSLWAFYQAGHIDHSGDIFPAGSVVKKGVTYSWAAQGDQSLLQYEGCVKPQAPPTTTPAQPTAEAGIEQCVNGVSVDANGTITLPAFEGGHWNDYGQDANGKLYDVPPGEYMFEAVADDGYTLAPVDGLDESQWGLRFVTVPASEDVDCTPPPPTTQVCTDYSSVHTTDLGTWDWSDTRATGHRELTANGLHIWTEGATSTDKVAGYYAVNYPLANVGSEPIADRIEYDATTGITPGLQIVTDFDNDGTADGILVGESVYGNSWWLSNSAAQFVKDGAPNNGGGYGSAWYGTINEWLAEFPTAQVKAIGFSLGSGVLGDGVIERLTFGCANYTFGLPVQEEPEPYSPQNPTSSDVCGVEDDTLTVPEDNDFGTYDTDDQRVDGVGTVVVTFTPGEGFYVPAPDEGDTYEVQEGVAVWTFEFTDEACPTTPPTEPPTDTPNDDKLATTGADTALPLFFGAGLLGLGVMALVASILVTRRRAEVSE